MEIGVAPAGIPQWRLVAEPAFRVTGAETGDSAAFARVGPARWLADGGFVVADQAANRLLVFDASGQYTGQLGRSGDGPAEFRYFSTVAVQGGDTISVFDGRLRRLSVWHPRVGFVRSLDLVEGLSDEAWLSEAWRWQDSMVVGLQLGITPQDSLPGGGGLRRWPMRAHLTLRGADGSVRARSPEFPGMYTGLHDEGDVRLPFSNQPFAAPAADRIYFGDGQSFRLRSLAPDFTVHEDVRWPSQAEPLTSQEVAEVRAEARAVLSSRVTAERVEEGLRVPFAPALLPSERPAIGRVVLDDVGRVWVERFEAVRMGTPTQKPGSSWSVLDTAGRPVARLVLPPRTRLESVRGDEVLVVQTDSLDVETVAQFRIAPATDRR